MFSYKIIPFNFVSKYIQWNPDFTFLKGLGKKNVKCGKNEKYGKYIESKKSNRKKTKDSKGGSFKRYYSLYFTKRTLLHITYYFKIILTRVVANPGV